MILGYATVIGENVKYFESEDEKYSESEGSIKKPEKVSCLHEAH